MSECWSARRVEERRGTIGDGLPGYMRVAYVILPTYLTKKFVRDLGERNGRFKKSSGCGIGIGTTVNSGCSGMMPK